MISKNNVTSLLLVCCTIALISMICCAGCITTPALSQNGIHIAAQNDRTGNMLASFSERYQESTQVPVLVSQFDTWDQVEFQEYDLIDLIIVDVATLQSLAEQSKITPITILSDGSMNKTTFDSIMLQPYTIESNLYGLPLHPDMLGFVIWADLFESEDEIHAFSEAYGYHIGNPLTYHDLLDIIAFISRPETQRYGIGIAGDEPDALQNLYESIMHSYGRTPTDEDVQEAEAVFQKLILHTPSEYTTWTRENVTNALLQRNIQSAITWFSEFETLSSPEHNPDNDKFIFLPLPGSWNSQESFHSVSIPRGWVFAVPNTPGENADVSAFLKWFYQPDTQWEWMQAGMQPMIHEIQESWEYIMANGYNAAYIISLRNAWRNTA